MEEGRRKGAVLLSSYTSEITDNCNHKNVTPILRAVRTRMTRIIRENRKRSTPEGVTVIRDSKNMST